MRSNKQFEKYHKMSAPIKASIWFAVCSVIQKGISLLSTPIFTRIMSTDQYGMYTVYQAWYPIIAIFATLNLYAGVYNNGMLKWPDDRKRYTSSIQGLSTTASVGLFLVYLAAMDFWNGLLGMNSVFMFAMFAELLFVPAYNLWAAGQKFDYRYSKLVVATIAIGLLSPILGVAAVLSTEHKAEARVLAFVFVQVCAGLIFYIYNLSQGKQFFNRKYWKSALAFNLPLITHYLSQTVLGQSDRIMIARIVGNSEAAVYSVAYTISMMFTIVTVAINDTFVPYTYKAIRDQKYDTLRKNANILVILIAGVCLLTTAFGPEIIQVFASSDYFEARYAVPPVAMALLFIFIAGLFGTIEFYFEETRFIMVVSSVAAIVNIILNYFFISMFGYISAAYTTLFCYALLALAHYVGHRAVIERRRESDNIPRNIFSTRFFLVVASVSLLLMALMILVYDQAMLRYIVVAVLLAILLVNRNKLLMVMKDVWNK